MLVRNASRGKFANNEWMLMQSWIGVFCASFEKLNDKKRMRMKKRTSWKTIFNGNILLQKLRHETTLEGMVTHDK